MHKIFVYCKINYMYIMHLAIYMYTYYYNTYNYSVSNCIGLCVYTDYIIQVNM